MRRLEENDIRAFFQLAGIPIIKIRELPDRYMSPRIEDAPYFHWRGMTESIPTPGRREMSGRLWPSFLVYTSFGTIDIGPRKRVIEINWNDLEYRGRLLPDVDGKPVGYPTNELSYIHSYSDEETIKHLKMLKMALEANLPLFPVGP